MLLAIKTSWHFSHADCKKSALGTVYLFMYPHSCTTSLYQQELLVLSIGKLRHSARMDLVCVDVAVHIA